MEQSVSLILLDWGDLYTKNTLDNKTLIPIGTPRIDMYVRRSCIVSGKQSMFKLKDRLGDQRGGGSEWEPIKILLEGD
jgi:hypothetical protein